jgi:hypothetical protein
MADHRAMEEEAERENPVNPKRLLHNRRETAMRNAGAGMFDKIGQYVKTGYKKDLADARALKGSGATPSMGLSQFRGGKHTLQDHLENPTKGYGRKKLLPGATRASPSEARQMGLHLGQHIAKLHGGAYHKDFSDGLMEGGGFWDSIGSSIGNAFNKVKNEFTNPDSVLARGARDAGQKVAHEFTDPNSILRDKVVPIGAQVAQYSQPFIDMALPGVGTALNTGFKVANYANRGAKMLGYGETGAYEGKGRRTRRPAGENDGRRKRAEIVRQVMREKGMKMIEASKYVKQHGLY